MNRAIIEQRIDNYHYRVRIPLINKFSSSVGATPSNELAIATVAASPGSFPYFKSGDIVYIDYEETDTNKPVIVGSLYNDLSSNINSDSKVDSLTVGVNVNLPKDTQIGDISASNLQQLRGLTNNVQNAIDRLNDNTSEISETASKAVQLANQNSENINSINGNLTTLNSTIKSITNDISTINEKNNAQDSTINTLSTNLQNIENKLNGPLILNNISYGTAAPETLTGMVEGQLYLWIEEQ